MWDKSSFKVEMTHNATKCHESQYLHVGHSPVATTDSLSRLDYSQTHTHHPDLIVNVPQRIAVSDPQGIHRSQDKCTYEFSKMRTLTTPVRNALMAHYLNVDVIHVISIN